MAIVYKIAPSRNSKLAGRKIVIVASVAKRWRQKRFCGDVYSLGVVFHLVDTEMTFAGRQHLSSYIDYDNYEARRTATQTDDDDDDDAASRQLHQPSTSRLYEKRAAAASSDVIDKVMECNQPTHQRHTVQRV